MDNITFNLNQQDSQPQEFLDKAAWEKNREYLHGMTPRHAPFDEPSRFPCLAFETGYHDDPNGPYQMHYFFIYDYIRS